MQTKNLLILSLSLFFAPFIFYRFIYRTRGRVVVASLEEVKALLKPSQDRDKQLRMRALTNARLVKAFKIQNGFTVSCPRVANTFHTNASAYINRLSGNSGMLIVKNAISSSITQWFEAVDSPCSTDFRPLDSLFRFTTFCTILNCFFGVDISRLEYKDVDYVTREINLLWCESKVFDTIPEGAQRLDSINTLLRNWIEGVDIANPLEMLIPAYETLWRVVAHSFVQTYDQETIKRALQECYHDPACFSRPSEKNSLSSQHIIQEVLRLYPPTRRISRDITGEPNKFWEFLVTRSTVVVAADIEALHRSTSIWGPDANDFRPGRHISSEVSATQRESLMAFGYGPLKCVATNWAPQAAAVLTGALLSHDDHYEIKNGRGGRGGREGWQGWEIRAI